MSQVLSLTSAERGVASQRLSDYSLPAARGCVEWIGTLNHGKYASYGQLRLKIDGRWRTLQVHRVAVMVRSAIPAGLTVDHLCYNTLCVNPGHLEVVTNSENVSRRRRAGRLRINFEGDDCRECGARLVPYDHPSGATYYKCPDVSSKWHIQIGK